MHRLRFERFAAHVPEVLLIALAVFVFFFRVGEPTLDDYDEAIYAEVAREMIELGEWLSPHFNYQLWFEKPPLMIWLIAVFFKLFWVGEFWSRFAATLPAVGIVFVTYVMARQLYGQGVALLSGLVLVSNFQLVLAARFGRMDLLLTLLFMLSLYGYLKVRSQRMGYWFLIWACAGLAIMVKSAAGVIGIIAVLIAVVYDRQLSSTLRSRMFWAALGLAVIIVAPWHLYMHYAYGSTFWRMYIGAAHVAEIGDPDLQKVITITGRGGGRLYYVEELQRLFAPWCYLAPFALAYGAAQFMRKDKRPLVLLSAIAVVASVVTLVPTKHDWYVIPIHPPLAILLAALLWKALESHRSQAFSALIVGVGLAVLVAPVKLVIISTVSTVVLTWAFRRYGLHRPLVVGMIVFLVATGLSKISWMMTKTENGIERLSRMARGESGEPLYVFSRKHPGDDTLWRNAPLFYSRRPTIEVESASEFSVATQKQSVVDLLIHRLDVSLLETEYEIDVRAVDPPFYYVTVRREGESDQVIPIKLRPGKRESDSSKLQKASRLQP